jgi:hypothetical protein
MQSRRNEFMTQHCRSAPTLARRIRRDVNEVNIQASRDIVAATAAYGPHAMQQRLPLQTTAALAVG